MAKQKVPSEAGIQISKPANAIWNVIFFITAIMCVYPLLLVFAVSFTDETQISMAGYTLFPQKLSLSAYAYIAKNMAAITRGYGVTIFVTIVGSAIGLLIMALYAYPLSREDFKYKAFFNFLAVVTMMFSGGLVPTYMVYVRILHLKDSLFSLILLYLFSAYYVMIIRTFYKQNVSTSLIEAAQIDGAGEFKIFFQIVLPLAKPALATVLMFSMLMYWNDWYGPLLYITKKELYNLQYLMYQIQAKIANLSLIANSPESVKDIPSEAARMAMAIVAIGPIILCYPFFQRYFEKGITLGGVKE
ncbi:sugar ABC transporter permease [Sporanaerobium hydrogeniformans]|uniref:Sugar ABC transporter permease n=1 Tax=Sporanaerobium hydrogeniformans TaxID=3072179 RepID=A0AC61DEV2_9FIRM|nr:carbohydrate ABC transporter permease [Sporanaerobium hydrogeniformans]PHV71440.1 sugar ABC transporter permease [Sporanaerobium hydrogeniformans]